MHGQTDECIQPAARTGRAGIQYCLGGNKDRVSLLRVKAFDLQAFW